eukprot:5259659-Pyramimonas_sp.AAC.1
MELSDDDPLRGNPRDAARGDRQVASSGDANIASTTITKNGKMAIVWHVAVGSPVAHPTACARSSRARSSGLRRPHPPGAGNPEAPPWRTNRPDTPPRRERLRGRSPRADQPQEEYPEGGMQRLVGCWIVSS